MTRPTLALTTLAALTTLTPPTPLAAQGAYPAAAHGGNYMHNFHFPRRPHRRPGTLPGTPGASASRWP